ncbi:unnamed protein product [Dovyalis caffra]|uniref:Uncharacterized protein n=1 Tax=Dovyalis caffra TaxID=77055 RepID=A0AAV1R0P9_9ROSI|nr:unnamed protein product [Dovyalis caffra]
MSANDRSSHVDGNEANHEANNPPYRSWMRDGRHSIILQKQIPKTMKHSLFYVVAIFLAAALIFPLVTTSARRVMVMVNMLPYGPEEAAAAWGD